jgi:hypothetical protein
METTAELITYHLFRIDRSDFKDLESDGVGVFRCPETKRKFLYEHSLPLTFFRYAGNIDYIVCAECHQMHRADVSNAVEGDRLPTRIEADRKPGTTWVHFKHPPVN